MKSWHCNACGEEWKTEDDIGVHFHACRPRYPRRYLGPAPRWTPETFQGATTLEEVWARTFADFAGGYQPPTPEEARTETGEEGQRRRGTAYTPRDLSPDPTSHDNATRSNDATRKELDR